MMVMDPARSPGPLAPSLGASAGSGMGRRYNSRGGREPRTQAPSIVHAARATARRSSASVTQRRSDRLRRQCASLEDARWITLETSRKTSEVVGRDGEVAAVDEHGDGV